MRLSVYTTLSTPTLSFGRVTMVLFRRKRNHHPFHLIPRGTVFSIILFSVDSSGQSLTYLHAEADDKAARQPVYRLPQYRLSVRFFLQDSRRNETKRNQKRWDVWSPSEPSSFNFTFSIAPVLFISRATRKREVPSRDFKRFQSDSGARPRALEYKLGYVVRTTLLAGNL